MMNALHWTFWTTGLMLWITLLCLAALGVAGTAWQRLADEWQQRRFARQHMTPAEYRMRHPRCRPWLLRLWCPVRRAGRCVNVDVSEQTAGSR